MKTIFVIIAVFSWGTEEYRGDPEKPWTTHDECKAASELYLPTIRANGGLLSVHCEPRP